MKRIACLTLALIMICALTGAALAIDSTFNFTIKYPAAGHGVRTPVPVMAEGGGDPWVQQNKDSLPTRYWLVPGASSSIANYATTDVIVNDKAIHHMEYLDGQGGRGNIYDLAGGGLTELVYDEYTVSGTWSPD